MTPYTSPEHSSSPEKVTPHTVPHPTQLKYTVHKCHAHIEEVLHNNAFRNYYTGLESFTEVPGLDGEQNPDLFIPEHNATLLGDILSNTAPTNIHFIDDLPVQTYMPSFVVSASRILSQQTHPSHLVLPLSDSSTMNQNFAPALRMALSLCMDYEDEQQLLFSDILEGRLPVVMHISHITDRNPYTLSPLLTSALEVLALHPHSHLILATYPKWKKQGTVLRPHESDVTHSLKDAIAEHISAKEAAPSLAS